MDDLARAVHQALKPLGYRKRKWAFNRQLGELVHVVELRHYFDDGGRHDVTVSGSIDFPSVHELAGAERPSFSSESTATFRSVFAAEAPLSDRAAVLANVDLALAVLGAFTDAESVVNEVRSGRALSLVGRGRQEAGSAALVLVATGRAHEALPLMQVEFERRNPIARPHLLRLAETVGITGIVTGADPSLSVTDESVLKAWSAAVPAKAALLAERADGVLRSQGGWRKRGLSSGREGVEQVSELLRSTPAALESPSSEQTVPSAYYGVGLEPAALQRLAAGERCALAEELAAFVAMSAVGDSRVPTWSIGPDKALVLKGREDWAALTDVYRIVHADLVHGSPATLVEVYERARRAVGSS